MQKSEYIRPENRKKILLLGDDLRHPSGVGVMSREIVLGTAHRFNWVQIGGLLNHPEVGKIIDISDSVNEETGLSDASVKIIPSSGYGNIELLRQVLKLENPDAIMIFTDPRYWVWLFNAEREIRAKIPIMYLNIWDDLPYPMWNKPFYESCDGLFAISKQTYNINMQVLGPEEAAKRVIRYIPHGIGKHYMPLEKNNEALVEFEKKVWGSEKPEFILLYNARNLGRKCVSNIILAWRVFCDTIGKDQAQKCQLLLHTDIVDGAGTDLATVYRDLCDPNYVKVKFLPDRFDFDTMNLMYNASDGVILTSSNEGWGLSITEALKTGKMFISTVSGGMQDQMRFSNSTGNWIDFSKDFPSNHNGTFKDHGCWCIPVFPSNKTICGSPQTPYIYDDRADINDIAEAIEVLYKLGPEKREEYGKAGYEWAISDEAGFTGEHMAERVVEGIEATLENFKKYPRGRYEIIKVGDRPSRRIDYDPVNY